MSKEMQCGHVATNCKPDGSPYCVNCIGIHPGAKLPIIKSALAGRIAKCFCGNTTASRFDLPVFQYRGPGSNSAISCGKCGSMLSSHCWGNCEVFTPRGDIGFDTYYCGCIGEVN